MLALIDARLISFGLVARQVGEDAREDGLHQRARARGPLELAEEVRCHGGDGFARVERGEFVRLCRQHGVVPADPGITFDKPHQLKDLCGRCIGDVGKHVDIQDHATSIGTTNRHQGLQRRIAYEIAAVDTCNAGNAALCGDNGVPIGRVFYGSRTGLHA